MVLVGALALPISASRQLSGGKFEAEEGSKGSASEAQRSTSPFLAKDETLYESFDSESDEELIELIKGYYLGPTLSVGTGGGCTLTTLIPRVCRFWDASSDVADGRAMVGGCLDGYTLMETSGSELRPLAVLLHRLGVSSRLGLFCGPGVQASTSKKRLLNLFYEFAPPSTVNGLICLASSPDDCMALFIGNWNQDLIEELETPEAVALCSSLGLSPTTSASAPRLLSLTFAMNRNDEKSSSKGPRVQTAEAKRVKEDAVSDNKPAFLPASTVLPLQDPAQPKQRGAQPEAANESAQRKPKKRPKPLQLEVEVPIDDSDSDSELGDEEDDLARRLTALITPKGRKAKDGEPMSSAAAKIIRTVPKEFQPSFTELVSQNRLTVISKQDLESLRKVFLKNKAAEEMLLAKRPIAENMMTRSRASGIAFLPLYQNTRLGCPVHLGVLGEELMVRMAGGQSLEASMAERQALIKDESIRQEHMSLGEILILLLDELHPAGVLELRSAERIMRRLVGLEIAAEKKAKTNQPIHKSMADLVAFMGTGMRVSSSVRDQTQKQ